MAKCFNGFIAQPSSHKTKISRCVHTNCFVSYKLIQMTCCDVYGLILKDIKSSLVKPRTPRVQISIFWTRPVYKLKYFYELNLFINLVIRIKMNLLKQKQIFWYSMFVNCWRSLSNFMILIFYQHFFFISVFHCLLASKDTQLIWTLGL